MSYMYDIGVSNMDRKLTHSNSNLSERMYRSNPYDRARSKSFREPTENRGISKLEEQVDTQFTISTSYIKNNVWYLQLTSGELYSRTQYGDWFSHHNQKREVLPTPRIKFLEVQYARYYQQIYPKPQQKINAKNMIKSSEFLESNFGQFYPQTLPKTKRETKLPIPNQHCECSYTHTSMCCAQRQCRNPVKSIIYTEIFNGKMYGKDSEGYWHVQKSNGSYELILSDATILQLENTCSDYFKNVTRDDSASLVRKGQALDIPKDKQKPLLNNGTHENDRLKIDTVVDKSRPFRQNLSNTNTGDSKCYCSFEPSLPISSDLKVCRYNVKIPEETRAFQTRSEPLQQSRKPLKENLDSQTARIVPNNSKINNSSESHHFLDTEPELSITIGFANKHNNNNAVSINEVTDICNNRKSYHEEHMQLPATVLEHNSNSHKDVLEQEQASLYFSLSSSENNATLYLDIQKEQMSNLCTHSSSPGCLCTQTRLNKSKLTMDDQNQPTVVMLYKKSETHTSNVAFTNGDKKVRNLDTMFIGKPGKGLEDSSKQLAISSMFTENVGQVENEEKSSNEVKQFQNPNDYLSSLQSTEHSKFLICEESNLSVTEDSNSTFSADTTQTIPSDDHSVQNESFDIITTEELLGDPLYSDNKCPNLDPVKNYVQQVESSKTTTVDLPINYCFHKSTSVVENGTSAICLSTVKNSSPILDTNLCSIDMKEVIQDALKPVTERQENPECEMEGTVDSGDNNVTETADLFPNQADCSTNVNLDQIQEDEHDENSKSSNDNEIIELEKESTSKLQKDIQEIIENLTKSLREKYQKETEHLFLWNSAVRTFPEQLAFELEDVLTKQIKKHTLDISSMFSSSKSKILLTGNPGFGKSSLCSMLAARWAKSQEPMKQFDLCLRFNLGKCKLNNMHLSEYISQFCSELISSSEETGTVSLDTAFKHISSKIILILDGFDDITPTEKGEVITFIKSNNIFHSSTVLLTYRTENVSSEFDGVFNSVMSICGFSYNHLEALLRQTYLSEHSKNELNPLSLKKFWRLECLTGLSPLFTFLIWRAVTEIDIEDDVKLFDILDVVMYLLGCTLKVDAEIQNNLYLKLGKLCYEALIYGYSVFSEDLLRQVLGCEFDVFSRSCIFFKPRCPQGISVWCASSKVLVQFLAVRYLRHMFRQQNDMKGQNRFLNNIFCLGIHGRSDFVTGSKGKNSVYQVGLIPDIVLKYFVPDNGCVQRTIEMLQDIPDPVEISSVFESCNLLLRTSREHLNRFSFLSKRENCLNQSYQNILNHFVFDEYNVDYEVFFNQYEQRSFLRVLVNESEENTVLSAVFRQNDVSCIDYVCIEFSVRNFKYLLNGLWSLFVHFFPGCDLKTVSTCTNLGAFVINTVLSIAVNCTCRLMLFECFGNIDISEDKDLLKTSSLVVSVEPSSQDGTLSSIRVRQRELTPCVEIDDAFNTCDFKQYDSMIQDFFDTFSENNNNHTVSIKITDPTM